MLNAYTAQSVYMRAFEAASSAKYMVNAFQYSSILWVRIFFTLSLCLCLRVCVVCL